MRSFALSAALVSALLMGEAAHAQYMRPRDVDALPSSKPTLVEAYGGDPLQFGELRLPKGKGPFPVAIVIHGGCWTKGFATLRNTAPMASSLAEHGIATWNIEYRQGGDHGGGWPGSFLDWGAAADHVRELAKKAPLDLARVVSIGHSAGAYAALWTASRGRLPTSSPVRGADPLPLAAAVAIDGPGDLIAMVGPDEGVCGKPVIVPFMGATPEAEPERYKEASPYELLPLGLPQYLIASTVLSRDAAETYRARGIAKGDKIEILKIDNGGHFDIIAPGTKFWSAVQDFILTDAFGAGARPPHTP